MDITRDIHSCESNVVVVFSYSYWFCCEEIDPVFVGKGQFSSLLQFMITIEGFLKMHLCISIIPCIWQLYVFCTLCLLQLYVFCSSMGFTCLCWIHLTNRYISGNPSGNIIIFSRRGFPLPFPPASLASSAWGYHHNASVCLASPPHTRGS
jgi:hypothetical protein